ncbi:hypothetical protein SG34_031745 [Thalassomonas viridans]|uniref:Uncharacterized protein n=1 Tax=Thalassomonas viridans TaxID=137584 RepID=A0AAE9ZBX9_9GAMM|nr:hypothetical protein [Thalassomonas viridans]WDE08498.1 hypothetical protein SG34_031745 [Thalassomonas viridans]
MFVLIKSYARKTLVIICLVLSGLGAVTANASIIYNWSGECAGNCTGFATGVLELVDTYTPGTTVNTGEVISWSYFSSSGSYTIPGDLALNLWSGALPVFSGTPLTHVNTIFAGVAVFNNFTDGEWNTGGGSLLPGVDFGVGGTWTIQTEVSEPGTLLSFTLALLLLGCRQLKYQRQKTSHHIPITEVPITERV